MDPLLQELLDKKACEEVLMRYGRTLDWLDQGGHSTCFWPDAEVDYGFFSGSGEGWVSSVMAVEMSAARRWHLCGGVLIELDGSTARSECYGFTVSAVETEGGDVTDNLFGGRYLDELEKREGEWRISKRRYILDFSYQLPNGLEAITAAGLNLPILQITEPGHADYRPL